MHNAVLRSFILALIVSVGTGTAVAARAPREAVSQTGFRVIQHQGSSHGYLAIDEAAHAAVLVDAPSGSATHFLPLIRANKLKVSALLLTHGHGDHVVDLNRLRRATKAPIIRHAAHFSWGQKTRSAGSKVTIASEEGQIVKAGAMRFQVMHVPGHSSDSIAFYAPELGALFAGDTLQAYALGGHHADPVFLRGLHRLSLLPPETDLWAGHGAAAKLGTQSPWIHSLVEENAPHLLRGEPE
jgi:glyoxylase-like metal-dependent hydrolase (beta-lactamase superfamily II)